MAKMEIYQSKMQAKTQKVMDVGTSLSLPFEIAQAQGASIDKLTSAIKKIRDERQATQDKNKARKIIKREELHCSDTKYGLTYKQEIEELKLQIELEKAKKPGYWELFAEFYYTDDNVPLYCRKYAKPKSLFKKPGDVCLSPDGKWEVIN